MQRLHSFAFIGMGLNAMLGVGLFLPMLPLLNGEHVLTPMQIGILAGAFSLVEGLSGFLYPRLLHVFSPKTLMLTGQIFCAISCITLISSHDFWVVLAGRLMGGWGGGSVSIAQYLIGRRYEGTDRVRALGQVGAAQAAGFMVGLLATAVAAQFLDVQLAIPAAGAFAMLLGLGSAVLVGILVFEAPKAGAAILSFAADIPLLDLMLFLLNTFVYISLAVETSLWAGRTPGLGVGGASAIFIVLAVFSTVFQARVAAFTMRKLGSAEATALGFAAAFIGTLLFVLNFQSEPTLAHAALAIAGLATARAGYSLIIPTTLARILGGVNAVAATQRSGWALFAGSMGSCLGPVVTGAIHDHFSLSVTAVLLATVALTGAVLSLATVLRRRGLQAAG